MEQGQPLRAVEPDEWAMKVRAKLSPETPTERQRETFMSSHTYHRFLGVQHVCLERPLMILIGDGKTQEILDWTWLHDHPDISAEVGMFNKKLMFKVLVSHRSGSVGALGGPKDVTEHMVRFVCDVLEMGFWCVCLKVSKRATRDCSAECCGQDKTIQDNSEKHAQIFAWLFGSL